VENTSARLEVEHSVLIENLKLELKINTPVNNSNERGLATIMHDHSYNEIFVCRDDIIEIKTENNPVVLNAGDLAVIPPTLHHRIDRFNEKKINFCAIGFTFTEKSVKYGFDLYSLFHRVFHKPSVIVIRNASSLSDKLYKVSEDIASGKKCTPMLDLSSILSEIAEKDSIKAESRDELISPSPEIERLSKLEHIINTKYMLQLTPKSIADELFISERHLSRIVNKRYNSTIKEVIVSNRIKTAEQLITSSNISISEICFMVGFKDLKTFYREFKKKNSLTPSEYRKQKSVD
jgi:AraC-like DNA-binding protein/mannose-6-phosphate isomerase-like protein (cupin superfamily)